MTTNKTTLDPKTITKIVCILRIKGYTVLFTGRGIIIRKGEKSLLWKGLRKEDLTF